MNIEIKKYGVSGLLIKANGRLDLDNSVEYGTKIKDAIEDLEGINELTLDFENIEFISSFGLKVVLELYKQMSQNGSMKLINVSDTIRNSFHMVGFDNFLIIK